MSSVNYYKTAVKQAAKEHGITYERAWAMFNRQWEFIEEILESYDFDKDYTEEEYNELNHTIYLYKLGTFKIKSYDTYKKIKQNAKDKKAKTSVQSDGSN